MPVKEVSLGNYLFTRFKQLGVDTVSKSKQAQKNLHHSPNYNHFTSILSFVSIG